MFGSSTTTNNAGAGAGFGASTFGTSATFGSNTGGSLFGSSTNASANTAAPAAPTLAAGGGGSLFGSVANTTTNTAGGGLFGSSNTAGTTGTATGLFGSSATATSAAGGSTGGGLFGSGTGTGAAASAPGSGLFGSSTATAPASTAAAAATSAAPGGGLFGTATTSATGGSTGLFGVVKSIATGPGSGPIFGSTLTTTTAPAAVPSAPAITRKTRFVDLPADIQKVLEEIERQKQVQIQIGDSIMTEETERELKEVNKMVQKLAHELHVIKMTLEGDKERVDDTKSLVNFAVNHAEKGASLVAHATDNGSWGQSGLTPLQVASRQRALLALQSGTSEGGLLFSQLNPQQLDINNSEGKEQKESNKVDPFEAVKRIQFASMNFDVTSEYYWSWLSRMEGNAQLLAERLDQLERHLATLVTKSQSADSSARPSPKVVSDVMQYQNDSFLAIAGKLAAVDDDVRRLKKKLAIKSK